MSAVQGRTRRSASRTPTGSPTSSARRASVPVLADWTSENPIIQATLNAFDHPSIPYYLIIHPEGEVIELDAVVTPGEFLEALEEPAL